jgi:hypothetical protein
MKSKTAILVLVAIIATGFLATNLSILAFAQKLPESGFGQAAKDLASTETGAVGTHSKAGSTDVGTQPLFNNKVIIRLEVLLNDCSCSSCCCTTEGNDAVLVFVVVDAVVDVAAASSSLRCWSFLVLDILLLLVKSRHTN